MMTLIKLPPVVVLILLLCLWHITVNGHIPEQTQLDSTDQQLDALTSRVVILSGRLDAILEGTVDADYALQRMTRNLDDSLGTRGSCKQQYFPCGPGPVGSVQCVRDYLVCDGSADCKNGADEASDICNRMPFPTEVYMPTRVLRDTCGTVGQGVPVDPDFLASWIVNAADIIPWFPSRPRLSWSYTSRTTTVAETGIGTVLATGLFDYVTGDINLGYDLSHGVVGPCKYVPVNASKILYVCELDNYWGDLDSGGTTCWLDIGVINK